MAPLGLRAGFLRIEESATDRFYDYEVNGIPYVGESIAIEDLVDTWEDLDYERDLRKRFNYDIETNFRSA